MRRLLVVLSLGGSIALATNVALPSAAAAWTTIYDCDNAWPSSSMPVGYRVTDNVASLGRGIDSFEDIRRIYREAFEAWSAPCCSSFSVSDVGTTTASGENTLDNINAVTVLTDGWPRSLGDPSSTLGVTVAQVNRSCQLIGGDVVFNAASHEFTDGSESFGETDFQSIAVHEFGHFVGLGHTNLQAATMYPAYIGGTQGRTLHSDDQEGVCTLYERACGCERDDECGANELCIDASCRIPPCETDLDCDRGLACDVSGNCTVPPCTSDAECVAGQTCEVGVCAANAACPICGDCQTNADCGVNGVCIPAGFISAAAACTRLCNTESDCPGNTDCFIVQTGEGDVPLCFNSDADVRGPCSDGFVCTVESDGFDRCEGVACPNGQECDSLTGQCVDGGVPRADCAVCEACTGGCGDGASCLEFVGGPAVCSVACAADGGCPGNSSCFALTGDDGSAENWCLNDTADVAGICRGGWTCEVSDDTPCEGVSCGVGQSCNPTTGLCQGGSDGGAVDAGLGDVRLGDVSVGDGSEPPQRNRDVGRQFVAGSDESGCGCGMTFGRPSHLWFLALAGLLGWRRRR